MEGEEKGEEAWNSYVSYVHDNAGEVTRGVSGIDEEKATFLFLLQYCILIVLFLLKLLRKIVLCIFSKYVN